ncbi:MAG: hypothetical protein KatS3mg129_2178 [Leptospiraceae bacterium]|nr:MAG: hypothetical protein KatS3mg129_2178 [Leptospiraceae bacterium]
MKKYFLLLLFLILSISLYSFPDNLVFYFQNPIKFNDLDKIKELYKNKIISSINRLYDKNKIQAFSVAIFDRNSILFEYHKNSSPFKLYQTASVSKLITATLTQIFFQNKIFNPDDKLIHFYPNLKVAKKEWLNQITLEHLLTHTAGFPDLRYYKKRDLIQYPEFDFKIPLTIYPPGKHYRYSNHGYMILGKIIEKKCKMSIEECAKKYIYKQLEMQYSKGPKTGAGGFITNINDIIKFGQMYLNFGYYKNKEILTLNSIFDMFIPGFYIPPSKSKLYTGRGWRIKYNPFMFTMFHIGGDNYVSAWLQLFPFDGYGLVYLGSPHSYDDEVMNFLYGMQQLLAKLTALYAKRDFSMVLWNPSQPSENLKKQFIGTYKEINSGEIIIINFVNENLNLTSNQNYSYLLFSETHHIYRGGKDFLTHHFIINEKNHNVEAMANAQGYYVKIQ